MSFPRVEWLALLGLIGCSGQIDGTVFLAGDNLVPAGTEQTLTHVPLKITHEGKTLGKANTDQLGKFAYKIEADGYYCVEIDQPNLSDALLRQMTFGRVPGDRVSSVNLGPTVRSVSRAAHQVDSFTPLPGAAPAQPPPPPPSPTPSQTEPGKETRPSPPPRQPDLLQTGKVCKNVEGWEWKVDIPYQMDYAAEVAKLPEHSRQVRHPGEIFTIGIPIPVGCVPDTWFIPDLFRPLYPSDMEELKPYLRIDQTSGRIDFRRSVRVASITLHLQVKPDAAPGIHPTQIEPTLLCPGGQTVSAPIIPIDVDAQPESEEESDEP